MIHGVTIGADTVIGAGAVVLHDLADRVVAYGVPARRAVANPASATSEVAAS